MRQNKKLNKAVSLYFKQLQRKVDADKNNIYIDVFNSGYLVDAKSIKKASIKVLEQLLRKALIK